MGRFDKKSIPFGQWNNHGIPRYHKKTVKQSVRDEIFEECKREVDSTVGIWLMTAFALALHREFGFGQQRCLRALNAIDNVSGELKELGDMESIAKLLKEELDITILDGLKEE